MCKFNELFEKQLSGNYLKKKKRYEFLLFVIHKMCHKKGIFFQHVSYHNKEKFNEKEL